MTHYVKATKRPSTRFNSPVESLVYSLVPDSPVSARDLVDIVLGWVGQHPEDGPIRGAREVHLAVDSLASAGWLKASLITPSRTA